MDDTWVLLCAAAALMIRFGLALYLSGAVRAKNAAGMALRVATDLCVTTLAFWAVGMGIAHQAGGFLGVDWALMFGNGGEERGAMAVGGFRLLVVALIASGVVVGAVAERMKFFPSLAASALMGGIIVPLLGRWVWQEGWLYDRGYHDLAGASVVHVAGAMCALAAAILVGPRIGKYNKDGSSNVIPGHSVPLVCAGMLAMLAGWLPYVFAFARGGTGASLGLIAMNVIVAGAAAGLASLIYGHLRFGKADIYLTFSGLLGGLVAISASADTVTSVFAVVIGAVAGIVIPWTTMQLDLVWKIDDPSAAIATHGVGGAWGILATGLFVTVPTYADKMKFVAVELLGLLTVAALALVASAVVFFVLKRAVGLRAKEADEFDGLDLAEHDIGAYPDFQQNTIKSYHLREA